MVLQPGAEGTEPWQHRGEQDGVGGPVFTVGRSAGGREQVWVNSFFMLKETAPGIMNLFLYVCSFSYFSENKETNKECPASALFTYVFV